MREKKDESNVECGEGAVTFMGILNGGNLGAVTVEQLFEWGAMYVLI